ncbi:PDDEXK nuclease domain-containing protein [Desulfonatronum thioautotrophicum]|uniref:PDDEXK nuclease domain-containing protein n=1 Tax=Desulfonatronum thioautotrophicum TaxID=617001 RepID=UPI0005EB392C|nr:PDDEXK nuclease domain-containing protein [Desulfonatronum thioautotrophicum]
MANQQVKGIETSYPLLAPVAEVVEAFGKIKASLEAQGVLLSDLGLIIAATALSRNLTAVDAQIKNEQDNPTIGLLLCKSKNKVVAEYALRDNAQPLGIAEYKLLETLPEPLHSSLPTIEQIEQELEGREI